MNTWERKLENLINEVLENTYTRADKTKILSVMYELKTTILLAEERKKNENKTKTRTNNNNKI